MTTILVPRPDPRKPGFSILRALAQHSRGAAVHMVSIAVLLCIAMSGWVSAEDIWRVRGKVKATKDADGKTTYTMTAKEGDKEVVYLLDIGKSGLSLDVEKKAEYDEETMYRGTVVEQDGKRILRMIGIRDLMRTPPQTLTGILKLGDDPRTATLTVNQDGKEIVYTLEGDAKTIVYGIERLEGKAGKVTGRAFREAGKLTMTVANIQPAEEAPVTPVKVTGVLKVTKDGMTVTAKEGGKDVVYTLAKPDDPNRAKPMAPAIKEITEKAKALDGKTVEVLGVVYKIADNLTILDQQEIKEVPAGK